MKRWLGWLAASCVLVLAGSLAWTHRHRVPIPVAAAEEAETEAQPAYAEAQQAQEMVTVTGPLADYVLNHQAGKIETLQPAARTLSAAPRNAAVAGDVGQSPVGTSRAILRQNFAVADAVDVPFELPAHASTPQLHGTYHAFMPSAGPDAGDNEASVEFLLFNQQQYSDFLSGRPSDALFSADAAHDQDVNVSMPPTFGQPAKYYLVFRNGSRRGRKNIVQADFRIDF